MDIPTTLVFITVLILVVAFVARPFVASRGDRQEQSPQRRSAPALRQCADLLAGRNRVYHALRDLDFDHQTNKTADEEYALQRHALVVEGVGILKKLDELAALGALPSPDPGPTEAALSCPQCGAEARAGDTFCGRCGVSLGIQE